MNFAVPFLLDIAGIREAPLTTITNPPCRASHLSHGKLVHL
jgi:hypothetical protein